MSSNKPQNRMPNIYEDGFVVICESRPSPRTPNTDPTSSRRKFSSVPPFKRKLTDIALSRLQRHHSVTLREGTPSPSSTKLKPKIVKKSSESSVAETSASMTLKHRASCERKPGSSASYSHEASKASSSDDDTKSLPIHRQPKSKTASKKESSSRKTSIPPPWTAAENMALWRFVLSQGEKKFAWKDACEEINGVSTNERTTHSLQQHWPKLRSKIDAMIEQAGPRSDPNDVRLQGSSRSPCLAKRHQSYRPTSRAESRKSSRAALRDEVDDLLDTDSD